MRLSCFFTRDIQGCRAPRSGLLKRPSVSRSDLAVFHVKQPRRTRKQSRIGCQGRRDYLASQAGNGLHEPPEVVVVQLGRGIVQQQQQGSFEVRLDNFCGSQHQHTGQQLLLSSRYFLARLVILVLELKIRPMRS